MAVRDELLSRAIVAYTGHDTESWPHQLPDAVVAVVGEVQATEYVERIVGLLDEAWQIGWPPQGSLIEDTERVRTTLRDRHAELSTDAVEALSWSYSYNAK